MHPRLSFFTAALKSSALRPQPPSRTRISQFICRTCQQKFSTSPSLRLLGRAAKKPAEKEQMYKSRLLIYDAGEGRTSWISFWKALALLQCGTTIVFFVPPLWKNENQPDVNLRQAQAVLVGVLGTIPTLTLAYFTAPFTQRVYLQIPEQARRSRVDLMRFAQTLTSKPVATANTKLEFTTLRIFPFRKKTTAFLHELRALPPRNLRLANLALEKNEEWVKAQRRKGVFKRMIEVLAEPRYKFYVKEGRKYTMRTGAPGVWEEVAKRIQEQTLHPNTIYEETKRRPGLRIPIKPVVPLEKVKRQTSRVLKK